MSIKKVVEIVEVGPRDGLQNEKKFVPTEQKIELIKQLSKSGIKRIEAASFVSPKHVPQMRDGREVMEAINSDNSLQYLVLIPNEKGYENAKDVDVTSFTLVAGASDTFNRKNVRMNREESMERLSKVIKMAKENGDFIRFDIATAFWCPFEGKVEEQIVLDMVKQLSDLEVDEIVLCDTIGRADPYHVTSLFQQIMDLQIKPKIGAHFHDTYGFGIANTLAALEVGVTLFDSSIGGLGGCPFAPGATGNVATEDLVFLFNQLGIETGIDLDLLLDANKLAQNMSYRGLESHISKVFSRVIPV